MSARGCGLASGSLLPQSILRQFDHKKVSWKLYEKSQSSCAYYLCLTDNTPGRECNDTSLSFKGFIFNLTFTAIFISTAINHSSIVNNLSFICSWSMNWSIKFMFSPYWYQFNTYWYQFVLRPKFYLTLKLSPK